MDLSPADTVYVVGLYDGELAYLDGQLRRFLAYLEDNAFLSETLVVIVGDSYR